MFSGRPGSRLYKNIPHYNVLIDVYGDYGVKWCTILWEWIEKIYIGKNTIFFLIISQKKGLFHYKNQKLIQ